MDNDLQSLQHLKATLIDLAARVGPKILIAVALLICGSMCGKWAQRLIDRGLEKFALQIPVHQLILRLVRVLVFGFFAIMALQNLGVELLPLIAGLGVAGAGIALAMQGVLGNLMAGLSVIFTKPFAVGEYISILGEEGQVESIGLFTTVLSHPDHSRVVIPNRKIDGEVLHNYGRIRQLNVIVAVAPNADLDAAFSAIREVLKADGRILKDPTPAVLVGAITPSAIEVAIKPWTRVSDFYDTASDIKKGAIETFRRKGIQTPQPRQEVMLMAAPALTPTGA